MTQQEALRSWLEHRLFDLYLGHMGIGDLSDDELWDMVEELENAQKKGELDLETEQGLTTLQEITSPYFDKE
jgi:hypothetical protein